MKLEVKIDPALEGVTVCVAAPRMTDEVNEIVRRLAEPYPALAGFCGDEARLLEPDEIVRVFCEAQKVFAQTREGTFVLRQRLYELEERLDQTRFVRISNSEIVNLRRVRRLDLGTNGTICLELLNGETAYASRRYVQKIKQALGI